MVNSETLKLQLVQTIINLPEEQLTIVRDLIADVALTTETVSSKRPRKLSIKKEKKPVSRKRNTKNPMLALIGCVSYEPPIKSIDEELYGDDSL